MAADNSLVTPQVFSGPALAAHRARDQQQIAAKVIPVTVTQVIGELVMVQVETSGIFTIPKILIPQAFSRYVRPPTQVGDKGYAISADYYLGAQSGIGGGTANYYSKGNLTNLVFFPISQKSFSSRNLNAVLISGPQGAVIQNDAVTCIIAVAETTITLVDSYGNKILMESGKLCLVPGSGPGVVFLGGDGVTGSYSPVGTTAGPAINVQARYA